jgi:hypothetical protein
MAKHDIVRLVRQGTRRGSKKLIDVVGMARIVIARHFNDEQETTIEVDGYAGLETYAPREQALINISFPGGAWHGTAAALRDTLLAGSEVLALKAQATNPAAPPAKVVKEFFYKDHSGRGYKGEMDEAHIREHWELDREDQSSGDTLEAWLESCEMGDRWYSDADELTRIR